MSSQAAKFVLPVPAIVENVRSDFYERLEAKGVNAEAFFDADTSNSDYMGSIVVLDPHKRTSADLRVTVLSYDAHTATSQEIGEVLQQVIAVSLAQAALGYHAYRIFHWDDVESPVMFLVHATSEDALKPKNLARAYKQTLTQAYKTWSQTSKVLEAHHA